MQSLYLWFNLSRYRSILPVTYNYSRQFTHTLIIIMLSIQHESNNTQSASNKQWQMHPKYQSITSNKLGPLAVSRRWMIRHSSLSIIFPSSTKYKTAPGQFEYHAAHWNIASFKHQSIFPEGFYSEHPDWTPVSK